MILSNNPALRAALIDQVAALDGKQCAIDDNRQTLASTVEALAECTSVDPATIQSLADQLSVRPEFVNPSTDPIAEELQLAKNTKIARNVAIVVVALFAFSMFKWLAVNGSIKSVMHDVSSVQSRVADFQLRTGRYPHAFDMIGYDRTTPSFDSIKHIEMGPQGQLLIETDSFLRNQMMLTPVATGSGLSKWGCTTNASWMFKLSGWLCRYQSSLRFSQS